MRDSRVEKGRMEGRKVEVSEIYVMVEIVVSSWGSENVEEDGRRFEGYDDVGAKKCGGSKFT